MQLSVSLSVRSVPFERKICAAMPISVRPSPLPSRSSEIEPCSSSVIGSSARVTESLMRLAHACTAVPSTMPSSSRRPLLLLTRPSWSSSSRQRGDRSASEKRNTASLVYTSLPIIWLPLRRNRRSAHPSLMMSAHTILSTNGLNGSVPVALMPQISLPVKSSTSSGQSLSASRSEAEPSSPRQRPLTESSRTEARPCSRANASESTLISLGNGLAPPRSMHVSARSCCSSCAISVASTSLKSTECKLSRSPRRSCCTMRGVLSSTSYSSVRLRESPLPR